MPDGHPVFISCQPTIEPDEDGSHIHIISTAGEFVWPTKGFKLFVNRGLAVIAKLDAVREVVPLRRRKGQHG